MNSPVLPTLWHLLWTMWASISIRETLGQKGEKVRGGRGKKLVVCTATARTSEVVRGAQKVGYTEKEQGAKGGMEQEFRSFHFQFNNFY